ncbi:MAG: EamA family transporter [Candidatus Omnitrophica bacterium]|nr:EamA family transporter [Candidatus Omnitrophota bacterium]MDD5042235.1 EamA family transporter [Candidatus Omnitrophota bacterium]MDD5500090.1 EamA family transporter [Candidatus Omnitrophota bacterium]
MKDGLLITLSMIALTSMCDTVNQLFLKSAIDSLGFPLKANIAGIFNFIFRLLVKPRVWLSFVFSVVSLCIWLLVLGRADLNFAFSADSMHYIFIAFASRFILKEKFTGLRWLGTGLIVAGIVFISLN